MATLIYRGIPHNPASRTLPQVPRNLMYRGLEHDGMTAQGARRTSASRMSYRGVAYGIAPNGRKIVEGGLDWSPAVGAATA